VAVEQPDLLKDIQEILGILLADDRQSWDLQSDGRYVQRQSRPGHEQSAQTIFMDTARGN
jgi:polyphosphate kinase